MQSAHAIGRALAQPFFVDVVPLSFIFVVVMGSMFMGWASPTDSAALGCRRRSRWRVLPGAHLEDPGREPENTAA